MKLINIAKKSALLAVAALAVTSCSHDDLELYSGVPAAVYIQMVQTTDIYGNPLSYTQTSGELSFSNTNPSITSAYRSFTVRLAGEVVDYDRPYKIIVDPEKTTALEGVDYDLSENEFCIKAGKASDQVRVKVLRNERFLKDTYTVSFQLLPNEYFTLDIDHYKNSSGWNVPGDDFDATIYSVSFSEKYTAPSFWSRYEALFYGPFTVKKFAQLNEIMGWTAYDWNYAGFSGFKVQYGKLGYATTALRNKLIEEAKKGTPILDEDGQPMQLADNTEYYIDYSMYL